MDEPSGDKAGASPAGTRTRYTLTRRASDPSGRTVQISRPPRSNTRRSPFAENLGLDPASVMRRGVRPVRGTDHRPCPRIANTI